MVMAMSAIRGAAPTASAQVPRRAAGPAAASGPASAVHIGRAIRPCTALRGEHAAALSGGRPASSQRGGRVVTQAGKWDWLPWVNEEETIIDEFGNEVEFLPVKALKGVRLVKLETGKPNVEYLIEWEDQEEATWEPVQNIAEDMLKGFEENWWAACRGADVATVNEMLKDGKYVLANTLDKDRRSGLHYSAGRGSDDCVKMLVEAGSDPNEQDKDKYTPLHIAAGYVHVKAVRALLEAGADPELEDKDGNSVLTLAENLRNRTPKNDPSTFQRRMALDEVALVLENALFEEIEPQAVLASRPALIKNIDLDEFEKKKDKDKKEEPEWIEDPLSNEYLIRWGDGRPDSWEPQDYLSPEVIADFEAGMEYSEVAGILDAREEVLGNVEYLVKWADGEPDSWELRENLAKDIVRMYERGVPLEEQAAATKPLKPTREEMMTLEEAAEERRREARSKRVSATKAKVAKGGRRVRFGVGKRVLNRRQGQSMVAGYSRQSLTTRPGQSSEWKGEEEEGEGGEGEGEGKGEGEGEEGAVPAMMALGEEAEGEEGAEGAEDAASKADSVLEEKKKEEPAPALEGKASSEFAQL